MDLRISRLELYKRRGKYDFLRAALIFLRRLWTSLFLRLQDNAGLEARWSFICCLIYEAGGWYNDNNCSGVFWWGDMAGPPADACWRSPGSKQDKWENYVVYCERGVVTWERQNLAKTFTGLHHSRSVRASSGSGYFFPSVGDIGLFEVTGLLRNYWQTDLVQVSFVNHRTTECYVCPGPDRL